MVNTEHLSARQAAQIVHGHSSPPSPTYRVWVSMKDRCSRAGSPAWADYGGRGISVCKRWQSFESFLADMGERPAGMTLDRIDNDGNYEPGNCRWATPIEQCSNKRNSRRLTHQGETLTVAEWCRRTGINRGTLCARLQMGWSVSRALTEPTRRNGHAA